MVVCVRCDQDLADEAFYHVKKRGEIVRHSWCLFDFNDPEQIKLAFAPENHQWLRKEENLAKHCKTEL